MRNLIEYPVTKKEILETLDSEIELAIRSDLAGDMLPTILGICKKIVAKYGKDFYRLDEL